MISNKCEIHHIQEFVDKYSVLYDDVVNIINAGVSKKGTYVIIEKATDQVISSFSNKSTFGALLVASLVHDNKDILLSDKYKAALVEKDGWDTW